MKVDTEQHQQPTPETITMPFGSEIAFFNQLLTQASNNFIANKLGIGSNSHNSHQLVQILTEKLQPLLNAKPLPIGANLSIAHHISATIVLPHLGSIKATVNGNNIQLTVANKQSVSHLKNQQQKLGEQLCDALGKTITLEVD